MALIAILNLLVGMVLGHRFPVLILAPAILLTLILSIGIGAAWADAPLTIGLTSAVAITCLQLGYLLGLVARHLMAAARASRTRAASFARSLPSRRAVH